MEEHATTWGERALSELFGSEVRAAVLSWICAHPGEMIFGAKLARELGMSPSAVGKELGRLEELGMLRASEPIGAAKPYTLNEQFPLLPGLRSMCLYATGVVAVLRELFADAEGVEVAAIFGSLARGDDRPESDVDVLVVGEIDGGDLAEITWAARDRSGRLVKAVHYHAVELAQRAQEPDGFVHRILSGRLLAAKGDVDELLRNLIEASGQSAGVQGESSKLREVRAQGHSATI